MPNRNWGFRVKCPDCGVLTDRGPYFSLLATKLIHSCTGDMQTLYFVMGKDHKQESYYMGYCPDCASTTWYSITTPDTLVECQRCACQEIWIVVQKFPVPVANVYHHQQARPQMTKLSPIYLSTGRSQYPKLASFNGRPEVADNVMIAQPPKLGLKGRRIAQKPVSIMTESVEKLAFASKPPAGFKTLSVISCLGDPSMLGVLITDWDTELAFYQELIIQIVSDQLVTEAQVESKFNRIIKLANMAGARTNLLASPETRREAELAAHRAITGARELCKLSLTHEGE